MATIRTTLALGTIAGVCCDELRVVYKTRNVLYQTPGYFGWARVLDVELVSLTLDGPILDENEQPVAITDEQERAILAAAERKIEEWI